MKNQRDIKKIAFLIKSVLNPKTYMPGYIYDIQQEHQNCQKLILDDDGSMRLNYDNELVRRNIYEQIKKYENLVKEKKYKNSKVDGD